MMKKCFLLILLISSQALAESKAAETPTPGVIDGVYTCRSEVKYLWKPGAQPSSAVGVSKTTEPTPAASEGIEVSFGMVETRARGEADAKTTILQRIAQEKTTALNRCRHAHENLAGCISTKYASMSSILNALSFTARSELEKAINEDCTKQSGRCISATNSDPECGFQAAPTPTPDPGASAAGDKGKKKK